MAVEIRPELQWFAERMEETLLDNDHKGGWQDMGRFEILDRIREEVREVADSMGKSDSVLIRELTDVANFCMFMAYNTIFRNTG